MAEAEAEAEADGDRVIEVVSAGALYRGGDWERKYWSCSRGKDRYPYPVGYHVVRHFSGISYTMQIQQGPRGPMFQVTSTHGDSSTGPTPDIAWKNFHKAAAAKVKKLQGRRSLPQKIDGAELFGLKNASVQRLLRELVIDSTGAVELNLHCPAISGTGSPLTHKVETDVSVAHEDLADCVVTAKRSMNLSHEEGVTKRVHYQHILTSDDHELDESARQISNTEEISCDSKCTLVDGYLGEYVPSSSQEDGLSSGPSISSDKFDIESAENEVAKSMMTFLLPQAIPLLKKTHRKKKVKQKRKQECTASMRTASAQNHFTDDCKGVTVPAIIAEGIIGDKIHAHRKTLDEIVKNSCANDDPVFKLDEIEAFVADSFEDDAQILGNKISKPMGSNQNDSDDAFSRDPNEKSKLLHSKREDHVECSERQVGVPGSTIKPDIIYDHEKGLYVLSDSLLACLEEEFGGNSDVEQTQFDQHFKEQTSTTNSGPSISMDGSDHNTFGKALNNVRTQASARHDSAIMSNGENTIMSFCHGSNVHNHNVFLHHPDHDLSSSYHLNNELSICTETIAEVSDCHLELLGCYLHPLPVLSIMLNSKNSNSLHIYVLCGLLESCQRFLYVYSITPNSQDTPPNFVGYTPLLLRSLERPSTENSALGRSRLQLAPDGPVLVLPGSIRIPCCRMKSISCSCSLCSSDQCDDNFIKIVSVNFGYVSQLTKLMPYGPVSCVLICEPNYIVAAENSRNLHIWMMAAGWSVISEEYVIPSLGNGGPSIFELRRIPKSSSFIIGHDGAGGFCLWDFSKRILLATFAALGNIVFQILPVGLCHLQEDIIHASVDDIERKLQEITVRDLYGEHDKDSILMLPGKDIAIWVLISSASVTEYQCDIRAKEHNARWKLALLAKNKVFWGNILDKRATVMDASGNYGFAGTYEGRLYTWELSSGRKLAGTQCLNCGRASCISVDAKSGVIAVADDGCQLLLYMQIKQKEVLNNARTGSFSW